MSFEREPGKANRDNLEFYTPIILNGEERILVINRGTTTVTLYPEGFSEFNHLRVLTGDGEQSVLLFLETPALIREADALIEYGFSFHFEQSPSELVEETWQNYQVSKLRNELDGM